MFLRRYEVRTNLVRRGRDAGTPDTEQKPSLTPEQIQNIAEDVMKKAAVTVVVVAGVLTAIHTVSEIAINNTNPANRKK